MKTKCIIIALVLITNAISYFVGSNTIEYGTDTNTNRPYFWYYNTEDALIHERQYCNAWMELAHYYLYDYDPSTGDNNNNYWLDVVSESDYYERIDSLNGGDWEDWDCAWN